MIRSALPRRRVAVVVGFVVAVLTAGGLTGPSRLAAAADPTAEVTARAQFRRAEADYAAGKYAVALDEYQAGYDAAPLPGFLVNIAQCQRRLGDLAHARATYQKFIMVAPDSPLVPEVKKLVAELDQLLSDARGVDQSQPPPADPDDVVAPGGTGASVAATSPGHAAPMALAAPQPSAAPASHVGEPGGAGSEAASTSHRRWWLVGGAVVAAAVVVTAVVLLSGRDAETIHEGSLGTLRR